MTKVSPERFSDQIEQLRRTLLWLITETHTASIMVPCGTCGHDVADHLGEADMCMYPASIGGPARLCRCEAFA
jgi:hypothetical protein